MQTIRYGDDYSVVSANGNVVIEDRPHTVGAIFVIDPGTSWTVALHDCNATGDIAAGNKIGEFVTASGKGVFVHGIPAKKGITVAASGTTPGRLLIVWS